MTRRLVLFLAGALALLMLVGISANADPPSVPAGTSDVSRQPTREVFEGELPPADLPAAAPTPPDTPSDPPRFIIIAIAVLLGVACLYLLSRQRFTLMLYRRRQTKIVATPNPTEEEEAEQIVEIAGDLIRELTGHENPRYAIQAAYSAVASGFGSKDLERKAAETPLRYLDRIFGRHDAVAAPLRGLTDLFQRARFSDAPVDEAMRAEAIDALTAIRDYYVSINWRKIARKAS